MYIVEKALRANEERDKGRKKPKHSVVEIARSQSTKSKKLLTMFIEV